MVIGGVINSMRRPKARMKVIDRVIGGVLGGASSVLPITAVLMASYLIREYYLGPPSRLDSDDLLAINLVIFVLSPTAGIIGGIMANNYIYSIFNGILYGVLTTIIIRIFGIILLRV